MCLRFAAHPTTAANSIPSARPWPCSARPEKGRRPRRHHGNFRGRSLRRRPPPAPGHPSGLHAEPPASRTGAVTVAPKPAPRRLVRQRTRAYTPATPIGFSLEEQSMAGFRVLWSSLSREKRASQLSRLCAAPDVAGANVVCVLRVLFLSEDIPAIEIVFACCHKLRIYIG